VAIIELTDNGLSYLSENDIYDLVVEKYEEIDPNINLDPSTPDGYMASWLAEVLRETVEAVVQAYNSKDPDKSRDTQLNIVGALTGSVREDGTPTVVNVTLSGVSGTSIPVGSVISDGTTSYTIDETVIIGVGGTIATTATCSLTGIISPTNDTITTIESTVGGWSAVTNDSINTLGTNAQSNSQFRIERNRSVGRPGNNQVDSAIGEIFAIDDVLRVAAYENSTDSAAFDAELNPHSLPAHSMSYLVQGGSDEDIAQAIYLKKNPGVSLNQEGTPVSVDVTSIVHSSNSKTIKFGRPSTIAMTVVIELSDPSGNLPANIEELIQNSIIDYVGGSLIDADDGFDPTGFDIGEDVPVRRIDTPINQVVGQYKNAYISTLTINGASTGAVTIDFDEISSWTTGNISVTVV
jgi:uncharacterized phage protein gp47/JayE